MTVRHTRARGGAWAGLRVVGVRACLLAAVACAGLAAQEPTFHAETELVNLLVTVTDGDGRLLTDLTRADLAVLEDGEPQTLRYFARGDDTATAPELHVGLLFDTSGSMDADIRLSRSAAIRFLNRLGEAEDITLVDFDSEVRVARFQQDDFPRLVERIRTRKPRGYTSMFDALGLYLEGASFGPGRKILVVFTDGGDTRSALSFGDAVTLVRASDVTIYSIGFLRRGGTAAALEQRVRLDQIASDSGGGAFFPRSMDQVDEAYDEILTEIHGQYSLGYVSTNTEADGNWRSVEIRVRRPGDEDARVRARKGYYAPYRPDADAH